MAGCKSSSLKNFTNHKHVDCSFTLSQHTEKATPARVALIIFDKYVYI